MKWKFKFKISYIVIPILAIAITGPLWYNIWDREFPVTFRQVNVVSESVVPGDQFKYLTVFDQHDKCDVNISTQLVDGAGILYEYQSRIFFKNIVKNHTKLNRLIIPISAKKGKAEIHLQYESVCNIFQRVFPLVKTLEPLQFKIAEATVSKKDQEALIDTVRDLIQEELAKR